MTDEITLEQDIEEALGMTETAEGELDELEASEATTAEPEDQDETSSEDDGDKDQDQ